MARLLGLDIGTSGSKALVIDEKGKCLQSAASPHTMASPRQHWYEQDPDEWVCAAQHCLDQLEGPFDGLGLTGQMHGSVFLDSDGNVLRPAILWCDQRTVRECDEIESSIGSKRVRQITGNPPLTGFQLPKIMWLRNHEPDTWQRVQKILLPKDYVRYRLTGEILTDTSDASGVGLLDISRRVWAPELLEALSLSSGLLPMCRESFQAGDLRWNGAAVAAGAGDQAAAAVGCGAVTEGTVSVCLGTSGVVFTPSESRIVGCPDSVHSFCHANGRWHTMGVMLSCGGAIEWARKAVFDGLDHEHLAALAAQSDPGSRGLVFLPYLAGERCPFNAPEATASWSGLTLSHGREEIARSVFEAATFGIKGCLDLVSSGRAPMALTVTGGGAASPFWLQMLADTTGVACKTLVTDQGPSFGAALLGGVAAGIWADVQVAVDATCAIESVTYPSGTDYSEALARYREANGPLKDRES